MAARVNKGIIPSDNRPIAGILILAAFIALFFWVPLADAFNISKLAIIIVLGAGLIPLVFHVSFESFKLNRIKYFLFLFFLLNLIINIVLSENRRATIFGAPTRFSGALMYAALTLVAVIFFQKFKIIGSHFLFWVLFFLGCLESIYSWAQVLKIDPISWNIPYGLFIGTAGNADFAGALIGLCSVATLWLVYFTRLNFIVRTGLIIVVCSQVLLVFQANVRQSLIMIFVGFSVFTVWKLKAINSKVFIPSVMFVVIILILVAGGALQKGPLGPYIYKVSLSMRGDYWRAALRMFRDFPLTGIGLGNYGDYFPLYRDSTQIARRGPNYVADASHSVFLDFLSTGGLFLFVSYCCLIVASFYSIFSNFRSQNEQVKNLRIGIGVLFTTYLMQAAISLDQIGLAVWGWVFLGCGLSFGRRETSTVTNNHRKLRNLKIAMLTLSVTSSLIVVPTLQADLSLKKAMQVGMENRDADSNRKRLEFLRDTVSKDRHNYWYYQNAALLLLESGQVEGIDFAKQALDLNPKDLLSAKLLAIAFNQLGDLVESNNYVKIVNKIDPGGNFELVRS